MPFFADDEQLYAVAETLFTRLQEEDPGATDSVLASHLVIRLRTSKPAAEFTLNGRRRPVQISYGPSHPRPTLDIKLAADTLHRILMDELSLKKALANGQLEVHGPVWKATVLADVFHGGQAIYPQVLEEQGLAPS